MISERAKSRFFQFENEPTQERVLRWSPWGRDYYLARRSISWHPGDRTMFCFQGDSIGCTNLNHSASPAAVGME